MNRIRLFLGAAVISCAATVLFAAGYQFGATIGACPAMPVKAAAVRLT